MLHATAGSHYTTSGNPLPCDAVNGGWKHLRRCHGAHNRRKLLTGAHTPDDIPYITLSISGYHPRMAPNLASVDHQNGWRSVWTVLVAIGPLTHFLDLTLQAPGPSIPLLVHHPVHRRRAVREWNATSLILLRALISDMPILGSPDLTSTSSPAPHRLVQSSKRGGRAPMMQLGVFPYAVTFRDAPKVGKELRRIHHGRCEFTGRRDEGQWPC